jgi:ABC-type transporter Mla subunit MlaD
MAKHWKIWTVAMIGFLIVMGLVFLAFEIPALFDDTQSNTLSGEFQEAACVADNTCEDRSSVTYYGVLALLIGILSLTCWLLWHFYVEPRRYLRKYGKPLIRS